MLAEEEVVVRVAGNGFSSERNYSRAVSRGGGGDNAASFAATSHCIYRAFIFSFFFGYIIVTYIYALKKIKLLYSLYVFSEFGYILFFMLPRLNARLGKLP